MTSTAVRTDRLETRIEADPNLPTVKIIREFDAPVEKVFRAHTESTLVAQWMGPRDIEMRFQEWDARTGGGYRYTAHRDGETVAEFYGAFHQVRPNERFVWTFGFEAMPDAVSLDIHTFTDLGDGRTRLEILSVVPTMEDRDAMLASGMEVGVVQGYEALDELLARDV